MGIGAGLKPFNLQGWIEKNRHRLQPPVNNQLLFEDAGMIVMAIGGPNQRTDYHDDPVEEYFYQLKGNMVLRVMDEPGKPPKDIPIREGEVMLLPPHVRHSPQRPEAGSVGIVVESPRHDPYVDAFEWYCLECHHLVYRFEYPLRDSQEIVTALPPLFEKFYGEESLRKCPHCGTVHPGRKVLQPATQ